MKLSISSEVELQDVQGVVVERRNGVSTGQERENISAWIVESLFPTTKTRPFLLKRFVSFKS